MLRILVVDNHQEDVQLMVDVLQQTFAAVEVEPITSPEALVQALETHNFQAAIIDDQMPWSSGLRILSTIKHRAPRCPVVMFARHPTVEVAVAGMKGGLSDCVIKTPGHYDQVAEAVRSALANTATTQHKQAVHQQIEVDLREKNQTLEALIQASPVAITVLDTNGVVEIWNPAAEQIFGWTAAEVIGKPMPSIPLDRRTEFWKNVRVTLEGTPLSGMETTRLRKDGSRVEVSLWTSLLHNEQGQVSRIMSIVADITERKQAQAERDRLLAQLETERAHLKAVLWQMPAGVIIAEAPSGKVVLGNEQVHQILRQPFTPADNLQEHSRYAGFHPDGRPYNPDDWPLSRSILQGEVVTDEEIAILRGDGTRGIINVSSAPIQDGAGRVVAGVTTFYDITERKQAEATERFLAHISQVLTTSLDYETTLQTLAYAILPFLADYCVIYTLEEQTIQTLAQAHINPETAPLLVDLVRLAEPHWHQPTSILIKVLKTGQSQLIANAAETPPLELMPHEPALQIYHQLGSQSCMAVPLIAKGRILGAIVLVMSESNRRYDISDLAIAEELARRASLAVDNAQLYRQAQEANRMKDEFLAILSHELRSPLNAILGWSQILRTRQLNASVVARALETIERNARSQAQLIEDLLDISRIIRGQLQLNLQPVEVAALVRMVIESLQPAAIAKNIEIQAQLQPISMVLGDPDRLRQILWNLLSNAVKFTPVGGSVQISLDSEPAPSSPEQVRITITDTGKGIHANFLPYVFDRFRQADSTTTRHYGGLGLGLAIVRHLVELHHGSIQASSPGEGQGATFILTLPLHDRCPPIATKTVERSASVTLHNQLE